MKEYDSDDNYSSDKDNDMKKPILVQKYEDTEIEKEREHKKILQELAENLQQESEEESLPQRYFGVEPYEPSDPGEHHFFIQDNLLVDMPHADLRQPHRNVEHLAFEPIRQPIRHIEQNIFSRFFSWTQHLYQRAHDGILNIVTSCLDAEHDEPERRF